MNKYNLLLLSIIGLMFTSCIPTNELIYLQNNNQKKENQSVEQIVNKPYRIQTNDILSISIKAIDPKLVEIFNVTATGSTSGSSEQAIYFNGYVVDDHGNIRFPILGEINVLGKTTEEIREEVEGRLLDQYFKEEAGIFVSVKLSGFRYTINGEVGSTGTKVIFQDKVNILEAIANAGDIEVTGNRKDVIVMRRFPQGNETYHIDLTSSEAIHSPVYYLQPNDYIYVKPLKQKTWGTGRTGVESISTIITLLSLATTTYLLLKR
ncbi:MAG: polysaccharide biosynthesis/export family protein [Flavobacterium sp.]|jgi:polysaccharide biosynthesis/export protein|uniref:polysaccharide biosynthesis/export family protein n=2 Tax=Flavobacterium sp. TaxID=239 RepID=UPI003528F8A6